MSSLSDITSGGSVRILCLMLFFLITVPLCGQPALPDQVERADILEKIETFLTEGSLQEVVFVRLTEEERSQLAASMPSVGWAYDSLEKEFVFQTLGRIGEIIGPEPVGGFTESAVSAAYGVEEYADFKRQLCARYIEYDCESDFDEEMLQQAFRIAREIVARRNGYPPDIYAAFTATGEMITLFGVDDLAPRRQVSVGQGIVKVSTVPDPVARIVASSDPIYWYTGAPFRVPVILHSDSEGAYMTNVGRIEGASWDQQLIWENPVVGESEIIVAARNSSGLSAEDQTRLIVEKPELATEPRRQPFSRVSIGSVYRPTTEWASLGIPERHYLTVVRFGDEEVFRSWGTSFPVSSLPEELMVKATTGPIGITVYWAPRGDEENLVPLMTTDPSVTPVVADLRFLPVQAAYAAPVFDGVFQFTFDVSWSQRDVKFDGIVARQRVGPGQDIGVQSVDASCADCGAFGLSQPRVRQVDDFIWELYVEVVDWNRVLETEKVLNGRRLAIDLRLNGRGGTPGVATIDMILRLHDLEEKTD